jgi:hypothetical protein
LWIVDRLLSQFRRPNDMAAEAGLALVVCLAQAVAPAPAEADLPVSVERIQRALAKPAPEKAVKIPTVFRVTVEGRSQTPFLLAPWDPANDTLVAPWVRPKMPIYHFEFLKMVTPEEFRSGTLFSAQISTLLEPVARRVADEIREAWQRRKEERARKEVDEALRQLLEARKKKAAEQK